MELERIDHYDVPNLAAKIAGMAVRGERAYKVVNAQDGSSMVVAPGGVGLFPHEELHSDLESEDVSSEPEDWTISLHNRLES